MTFLCAEITTSISMHAFSFFVFNYYIWPIFCNFSVCNIFLFNYWFVCVYTIILSFQFLGLRKCAQILYVPHYVIYYYFKFILAYQLLGGVFLVRPDLNKRSRRLYCRRFSCSLRSHFIIVWYLSWQWRILLLTCWVKHHVFKVSSKTLLLLEM